MKRIISKPSESRLIKLARLLEQLEKNGKTTVSSAEIQQRTGWTSFTVRRDISMLKTACSSSAGYAVKPLHDEICNALNLGNAERICCIVGLGRLGTALAGYNGFKNTSFRIAAGFDTSVNRTETLCTTFPLYPASQMERVIKQEHIKYAILAVSESTAQETALRLSSCGILGIVNYTSAILHLPEETVVENLSVIDALQNLECRTTN